MSGNGNHKVPDPNLWSQPGDLRKTAIHPDYWYPLARSRDVKKGKSMGVSFAGNPIVLVRTESGTLFALEDRCAHRQVPLRFGVVHGEQLQCSYHCWQFDKTGRCVKVPYMNTGESLPKGVRSYPCREAYGLIFVFPGDIDRLPSAIFPDISTHDNPHYKTRYLDRKVGCHYSFMHENLMDMNHQFLHRRYMGRMRTVFLGLREGENWIEGDYTFTRATGTQPLGEKLIIGRRSLPPQGPQGRDLMTIRTQYPYQTLTFQTAGSENTALELWIVYVPVDREQRVTHTFGLMMFRKPSIPGLIHLLWPFLIWFTERIFAEDRWIVEEEQKAFESQGADWNQEIFPLIIGLKNLLTQQGLPLSVDPASSSDIINESFVAHQEKV